MTAITTLRSTIATAIADNTLYNTFAFPPARPLPNSVIVTPADPYISPNNNMQNSISPMANFKITILLPLLDNEANLGGMEQTAVAVFNKLCASSINFKLGSISAPSLLSTESGDLLSCDLTIQCLTEWS